MGIAIPQVVTEDRASGALVVDGSLKFDRSKTNILKKTFGSVGNRKTWTLSFWHKKTNYSNSYNIFTAGRTASTRPTFEIVINSSHQFILSQYNGSGYDISAQADGVFRDTGSWYHFVIVFDTTDSTDTDKVKIYVNGRQRSVTGSTWPSTNEDLEIGNNVLHNISANAFGDANPMDGYFSNFYYINGLSLGPGYFGYTDPLTNTWRPKKFKAEGTTVNDGTVWSAGAGANFDSSNPATNGFDGNPATYARTDNANVTATVTFSKPIPFANLVVRGARDSGNGIIKVNGVDVSSQYTSGSSTLQSVDLTQVNGVSSPLTSISLTGISGSAQPRFATIVVDGVVMQDSTTTNLDFGTNGFYLPLDGNSPIGEDKSGKGNDFTPVNFGGSVALDNPQVSGARPILNTLPGGTQAGVGVFGSEVGAYYATTSASNSGGKYYFSHDASAQPTFSFIRGATYTFDYSASSSHPLRFATAADAAGSTEYTDGTSISGNVIKFTVPHNAPNTLYYYCNVHNGMGNSISVTTDETKADPYAWKNVLALPLVGSNSDVSDQINCASTAKVLAKQGNVTASSTQSNFYNGSFYFDGSGDYLGATTNADFAMGTGDFTLECWVYRDSSSAFNNFIGTRGAGGTSAGFTFGAQSNGNGNDIEFYTDGLKLDGGSQTITNGKWHHVAVTRTGTTLSSYVNGILNTTASNSQNFSNTSLAIGMTNDGSQGPMLGYIQDVRIYKGVAKYSGGSVGDQVFIPASTNPDILPDTPSGVSGGSKLVQITGDAVSFPGATTDYLSTATSSDYAFGTGDFTVEGYVYQTSQSTYPSLMEIGNHINTTGILFITSMADGNAKIYSGGFLGGTPLSMHRWNHVAFVRISGVLKIYVNGLLGSSDAFTNDLTDVASIKIGGATAGSGYMFGGQISNVRVVKGTAVYTGNFTPPTRTLTNVTNTKLLCCQSNATSSAAAVSPQISGINDGTVWSHQNSFAIAVAGTTETGSLAAVFNPTTGVTGAADSFGFLNGAFDYTYTPNTPISYSNKVRVWTGFGGNVYLNGGSAVSTTSNNWTTLATGSSGTVTSIRFTASGSGGWWSGLEIDDVMLVDPVNTNGNAAATNFNPFNTDINTVRGQETGYCTWNPLTKSRGNLLDGNLLFYGDGTNTPRINGSISQSSGKWYYEATVLNDGPGTGSGDVHNSIGWGFDNISNIETAPNNSSMEHSFYFMDSGWYKNFSGSNTDSSTGKWLAGDVIGVAADLDNNILTFYKNGIEMLSQTIGTTAGTSLCPAHQSNTGGNGRSISNFGQKPFKYAPPAGFQSLNAASVIPETVITRPDQYFGMSLYTGNGTQTIVSNLKFFPDFVWIKSRTTTAYHMIFDTVRGAEARLHSNTSSINQTGNNDLTAFNNNGYTLDDNSGGANTDVNGSGTNYVGWSWKAGGNKNTFNVDDVGYASAAAAGLDGGTLTVTGASVGTKQGFSIIKYTGNGSQNATFNHGLNEIPKFVIIKNLDSGQSWDIYHASSGYGGVLRFSTNKFVTAGDVYPSSHTTSTIKLGSSSSQNGNTDDMIAYCWHDVPGLQKFGKYTANSAGVFVELGFKPALLVVKNADANLTNSQWNVVDPQRDTYNPSLNNLAWDRSNSEPAVSASTYGIDMVSNGFHIPSGNTGEAINNSTNTYIYMAWAEAPQFNLYGAQSNAR